MPEPWVIIVGAAVASAALVFVMRRRSRAKSLQRRADAMSQFAGLLPQLEPAFLTAADATGKPRGLRWTACRLEGEPLFAVDRTNAELFALVAATVSFEAIEGGDMEEVEAVGNLRAGTAVFVHRDGKWTTDGRAVFNLDPAGTLVHYRESLAPVTGP